jgi:hypothetical protein
MVTGNQNRHVGGAADELVTLGAETTRRFQRPALASVPLAP